MHVIGGLWWGIDVLRENVLCTEGGNGRPSVRFMYWREGGGERREEKKGK